MNVEVSNLHFGYEKAKPILNGLSFNVAEGEILGVLGGSGSGKSTLLRLICGILQKTKTNLFDGAIAINGIKDSTAFRKNGQIGFMFQEPALLPNLSLKENIHLPGSMNRALNYNPTFADDLINFVGLEKYKKFLPKELSGGMQTRVALARTFVTKPQLLLLDEPFSSLDYGWKTDLYKRLIDLVKQFKSTTIIVSHDINELILLCDRVIILSKSGSFLHDDFYLSNKPNNFSPKSINDYLIANNEAIVSIQSHLLQDKN